MNNILLCEGKTDAVLISYYLGRMYGWKYEKNPPKPYKKLHLEENQNADWYKKDNSHLLIFAVGGKDNFEKVIYEYILEWLVEYKQEESFQKLVIVQDSDNYSINEIRLRNLEWLSPYISDIKAQNWVDNSYLDAFSQQHDIQVLSIVIPKDKQGALETMILDSFRENEYDKSIVDKCCDFVENMRSEARRYIKTDRLELKAKLSTVFAIRSPEKVFSLLDEIMKGIQWEKSEVLKECFCKLERL